MKTFGKILGGVVLALVLLAAGYAGSLYLGWLPVPALVTDQVARARGLSPSEAQTLHRVVNLWGVLKRSPEAPIFTKALDMAPAQPSPQEWMAFAQENYPKVSPATREQIREQLGIEPADFQRVQALLEARLADYGTTGKVGLSASDQQVLAQFDQKYHLLEGFRKLGFPK